MNTATIGGGGVSDTDPGNNSATDTDTILPLDYGDAPDSAHGPPWAYPTLVADNGARHGVNGGGALRMGAQLDTETDGQPTVAADGDDQVSVPNVDDEDGVTLPAQPRRLRQRQRHGQRLGGREARRLRRLEPQRQLRRRRREDLRQPGVGGGGERPALQRALHRHADDEDLRPLPPVDGR